MATKTLNARVQMKYDTLANFQANTTTIWLSGEMLFVQTDDNGGLDIYLGDGVHTFGELKPFYSSKWVMGRNTTNLQTIQIQPTDWVNKKATKTCTGVLVLESEQLLVPAWASQSKEIAESCGVDYIVSADNTLEFSCNVVPTEPIIMYMAIFGRQTEEDNEGSFTVLTVDTTLSSSSTNPVENRAITSRILGIESSIREITGQTESGGTPTITETLPEVSEKLTTATTYSLKAPSTIGTYVAEDNTESEVKRLKIPFTLTVSRAGMDTDSDLSSFTITVTQTLNLETMTNAYWTGKSSNGAFFGSCPIIVTADKKVKIISVPIEETAYTLTGEITIEYV